MTFDSHGIKYALKLFAVTAAGGAVGAIVDVITRKPPMPTFDPSNSAHWQGLWAAALIGATTAVLGLYQKLPRNPMAYPVRVEGPQIAAVAKELGITPPASSAPRRPPPYSTGYP